MSLVGIGMTFLIVLLALSFYGLEQHVDFTSVLKGEKAI